MTQLFKDPMTIVYRIEKQLDEMYSITRLLLYNMVSTGGITQDTADVYYETIIAFGRQTITQLRNTIIKKEMGLLEEEPAQNQARNQLN